jgi:hypothetical protein
MAMPSESAATAIGGQEYIYALRGDGREPVKWVPAARQNSALEALMLTLRPSELALSPALIAKIPPRPSGLGRTRELFPRQTGGAFDPIAPAMVAADITIGSILTADRAARLVAQRAMDSALPGLDDVLGRLVQGVFEAPTANDYEAEIKRSIERVLVSHLMSLASSAPMSQVRAIASMTLRSLQTQAEMSSSAALPVQAHRQLLASDIKRFIERPFDSMLPASIPSPPPGAPIGDYGMDYLLGLDGCFWTDFRWR